MARSAIEMEQYMDFLRNRTFRQTLLCHQEVTPTHTLSPDQIAGFTLCSRARPADPDANLADRSIVRFEASDGAVLSTDHPLTKMAMLHMALSWPRGFAVDELIDAARARLAERAAPGAPGDPDPQDALVLSANMLKAYTYSSNLVELHLHEPHLALHVSDRPQASPVARLLARRSATVTNLRHERVDLDEVERLLLLHLDGDHDLDALAGLLSERGARALDPEGELIADPAEARAVMVDSVRRRIGWLARAALLIA